MAIRLSVVIVNYNVRYFLEQALGAVRRAALGLDIEIWVVDNNSIDDSVAMVRDQFPEVKVIANTHNPGFAVANNQAILQGLGDYVLLLNPDTVVEEGTFRKCIDFMDAHPQAGGLGVRMIDGSGTFLPESKRGFPSAWVAFCKTFGLARLFPKSKRFNTYHLGYVSEFETAEIDVLAGAFMFMRRSVLDKVGLLDEAFFMYGEDIDLSYRIQQAGFKNYYFPATTIIHYKGESTKKGSLNYVKTFYQAMIIFARKHFVGQQAALFILLLQAAIWFRALLALGRGVLGALALPLTEAVLMLGGLWWLKNFWGGVYFKDPSYYKIDFLLLNAPLYIFIWLGSIFLHGGYDKGATLRSVLRGLAVGTVVIAAVYGFLPMMFRNSRALIILGAFWAFLVIVAWRFFLHFLKHKDFRMDARRSKNIMLMGSEKEAHRVEDMLLRAQVPMNLMGTILTERGQNNASAFSQLEEMVQIYSVDELIFCSRDVESKVIMDWMSKLGPKVLYKIVPEDSKSIIGSHSKNEPGELYVLNIDYNVLQPQQKRFKRMIDLIFCVLVVLLSPFLIWRGGVQLLRNWWAVFLANKTWVSYAQSKNMEDLPPIKQGILLPADAWPKIEINPEKQARLNFLYAKEYQPELDVRIILKNLNRLGRYTKT